MGRFFQKVPIEGSREIFASSWSHFILALNQN